MSVMTVSRFTITRTLPQREQRPRPVAAAGHGLCHKGRANGANTTPLGLLLLVTIIVVIVTSISRDAAITLRHVQRLVEPESDQTFRRKSDIAAPSHGLA